MDKEKAIDLVQKVLAKANNNTNQHEAELAMLKAQELMVKYNLEMSEISDIKEDKEVVKTDVTKEGKTLWWVKQLASVIGKNFRCEALLYTLDGKSKMVFIGLKEDVAVAVKVFGFATDSMLMCSDRYIDILKVKNGTTDRYTEEKKNYIQGFIEGIKTKYAEQVKQNGWGLILVKDKMVTDYLGKLDVKKTSAKVNFNYDATHFEKGFKDGKQFEHKENLLKN
jgi:hypothetical protein